MKHDHAFFEALNCPSSVTWAANIQQMFTATDVARMKAVTGGSLDLSDYMSVKIHASAIFNQVANGQMPPPGSGEKPWSPAWVNTFGCWINRAVRNSPEPQRGPGVAE